MGKYILYNTLSAFVKINILIVTLFVIGTETTQGATYTIILGLLGIIWVIFPIVEYFLEDKNDK